MSTENLFRNCVDHGSTSPRSQPREESADRGSASDPRDGASADGLRSVLPGTGPDGSGGAEAGTDRGADPLRVTIGSPPDGFYVEDDGVEIPPDDRERIFERGYTTAPDGTGLGLGIGKQIAGAHGWTVRAVEGTAGGARFETAGVEFGDEPRG